MSGGEFPTRGALHIVGSVSRSRSPSVPGIRLSDGRLTSVVGGCTRRRRTLTAGHGGVAATSRATKVARSTIGRGIKDLEEPGSLAGKVRRKGAGRPAITTKDPTLLDDLRQLLEPADDRAIRCAGCGGVQKATRS